jgi:hypothetical protein
MGGFRVVNGARREAVGCLTAVTRLRLRPSVEHAGPGPIAEDLGQFRVKLGEYGAQGALAGRVGAGPEVTGNGERGVPKDISDAEASSHFAIRLLSRPAGPLHLANGGARDGIVTAHRRAGWSFPSVEGRLIYLPGVHG